MSVSPVGQKSAAADEPAGIIENCIEKIAGGDTEGLSLLYGETHAAVFGYALSILKNRHDAEDAEQDVYVRIWQSAPEYQPMGRPLAWIFTVTRNVCLQHLRNKSRTVPMEEQDWQELFADRSKTDTEDRLLLDSVMEILDDEERQIVMLHAVAGLKHRETAALLNLGLSTVLSKYNRALKKLRKALEEA